MVQCGTFFSLVLQKLLQLGGAEHSVLSGVAVENGLQLRSLQQPTQELLDLSAFQTLVIGAVTVLEGREQFFGGGSLQWCFPPGQPWEAHAAGWAG